MKLKICGLKDPKNIKEIALLKPDYMGFIFYEGSKRFVGDDFIMPVIPGGIKKTGVFVNSKADYIIDRIDKHGLDAVQLHGNESPGFCEVMSHFTEVIKVFGVDEKFELEELNAYEGMCQCFLFDTKTKMHGGSGRQFDHSILKSYKLRTPFFISGGIGLEEMEKLKMEEQSYYGVDVNSRFELESGLKDIQKLKQIIR